MSISKYLRHRLIFLHKNEDKEIAGNITDLKYSKFLELVVEECVDVVKNLPEIQNADNLVKAIRNHFGLTTQKIGGN